MRPGGGVLFDCVALRSLFAFLPPTRNGSGRVGPDSSPPPAPLLGAVGRCRGFGGNQPAAEWIAADSGCEAFATLGPTSLEDGSTGAIGHPVSETVLALTTADLGLKSTFHDNRTLLEGGWWTDSGYCSPGLSVKVQPGQALPLSRLRRTPQGPTGQAREKKLEAPIAPNV